MGFFDDLAQSIKSRTSTVAGAGARTYFGAAEKAFSALSFDDAANNLRHYRGGTGLQKNFSDDEIAKHIPVTEAEDENRT